MNRFCFLIFGAAWVFCRCETLPENAPTYGSAHVVADETLFPLVDALEKAFEHTYPKATISVTYLPESQAFQQFYDNDSTVVVLSARQLTGEEDAHFTSKKLHPRTAILANDAIALLTSPANPDTNLTCEQALQCFRGETTDWSQISPANRSGGIRIVFDHQGSSTVGYVLAKSGKAALPPNSYALKTTEAVVDYVAANAGAIGIVGYSWLSDYDDPACRKLRSKVKVLAVSPCGETDPVAFYKPFADNVQEELYPFSRQVFAINRETNSGTGTGFTAFMAGEVGQRIISKAGITPAYKVERNIELKSEPFKVTQ